MNHLSGRLTFKNSYRLAKRVTDCYLPLVATNSFLFQNVSRYVAVHVTKINSALEVGRKIVT